MKYSVAHIRDPITREKAVEAERALTCVEAYILRIILRLRNRMISERTRWTPSDQHAVRILRSRQRHLARLWLNVYGTPEQAQRARTELTFRCPDRGDVLILGTRTHTVGWLGCGACDTTGDTEIVSQARVYPHCGNGVQHAAHTVAMGEEVGGITGEGEQTAPGTLRQLPGGDVTVPRWAETGYFFYCDGCGTWDVRYE